MAGARIRVSRVSQTSSTGRRDTRTRTVLASSSSSSSDTQQQTSSSKVGEAMRAMVDSEFDDEERNTAQEKRRGERKRRTEDPVALLQATTSYQKAVGENGIAPEAAVALEVYGLKPGEKMTKKQREYVGKIVDKLEATGASVKNRQATAEETFLGAQSLYESSKYEQALEAFEAALSMTYADSLRGGAIQIWIALTLERLGREEETLAIYLTLEENHPNSSVKRQAENLRYILIAPPLKMNDDERVVIPDLSEMNERNDRRRERKYRKRPAPMAPMKKREKTLEERVMDEKWQPMLPYVMRNKIVQVWIAVLTIGLTIWSTTQK